MVTDAESSVDRRLVQLFRHLGLEQVHIAARVTADWHGLAATHPETIASLTLVCPTGLEATPLVALASRVLVLTGDQGAPAEAIRKAMAALPEATLITFWRAWTSFTRSSPCLSRRRRERWRASRTVCRGLAHRWYCCP